MICSLSRNPFAGWLPVVLFIAAGHAQAAEPSRAMLGVTLHDEAGQVIVSGVYVGGPATAAGLRPGDRIIAVNDKVVHSSAELVEAMAGYNVGSRIEVRASRDGWTKQLPITLGNRETVSRLPLSTSAAAAPQTRTRNSPNVVAPRPLVNPSPFYRKRNERW